MFLDCMALRLLLAELILLHACFAVIIELIFAW